MAQCQPIDNDQPNESTAESDTEVLEQPGTPIIAIFAQDVDHAFTGASSHNNSQNSLAIVANRSAVGGGGGGDGSGVITNGTVDSLSDTVTVGNIQVKTTTGQLQTVYPIESHELASTSAAALAAMNAASNAGAAASTSSAVASTSSAATAVGSPTLECPICLQSCIHPARLPCGHIFCFLCVKGVASKNRRCAMCRREIPIEFLEHPQLVNGLEDIRITRATEDGYQWFYEGRNGWWQYDDRTSQDIEEAFKKREKSCTILVAGYVYIVDLEQMIQQRQNEPARCRRVKRDLATIPKKGVAGLRIEGDIVTAESSFSATRSHDLTYSPQTNLVHAWRRLRHLQYMNMHGNMLHLDSDEDDDDDPSINFVLDYDDNEDDDDNEFGMGIRSGVAIIGHNTNHLSGFMPNLAATNAAINIASNIIDSTLAHANDGTSAATTTTTTTTAAATATSSSNGMNGINVHSSNNSSEGATARSSNSLLQAITASRNNALQLQQEIIGEHISNCTECNSIGRMNDTASVSSAVNAVTRNNINNNVNDVNVSGRTLPAIANNVSARHQNMIAQANATAIANNQSMDLFEQTLNTFQALNLNNIDIADSSEESDDNDEHDEEANNNQNHDKNQKVFAHTTLFK